jgi:hypothetical protein
MRRHTARRPATGLLAFVAALALVAAAGPGAATADRTAGSLFPLADGNRWTYRSSVVATPHTMAVDRRGSGLVLEGFPGAGPLRVRPVGASVQAWDAVDARWEPLLRLGAPTGSRLRVSLAAEPVWDGALLTVAATGARLRVLGRIRSCVRLAVRPPASLADAGVLELWFAPGLGLVRFVEQTILGPRAWTLASRRVGG